MSRLAGPTYAGAMPSLGPRLALAALTAVLLLTGCVDDDPNASRPPGDEITTEEAQVLAEVLNRNYGAGGAEVTVSAPYSPDAVLELTGTVDFTTSEGTLDAVTSYSNGQPEETRTVYFTADRILIGNLPGFATAMADAGRPEALYLRLDLDQSRRLIDNVIGMIQRLGAEVPDDPDNLIAAGYTWQGNGRIDNTLISTFTTGSGTGTISIGAQDRLLHQFVSPPPGGDFPVTITLSGHGTKDIEFPPEAQVADASAYPDVAVQFGF